MTPTEAMWTERVSRWRKSGLTAQAFADQEQGFQPTTLRYWASRLPRASSPPPPAGATPVVASDALRLLPVQLRVTRDLEVRVGDVTIIVPEGIAAERVAALVRALRAEAP